MAQIVILGVLAALGAADVLLLRRVTAHSARQRPDRPKEPEGGTGVHWR